MMIGRLPACNFKWLSRSAMSLCLKIMRSALEWRMPSIIEAWLPASDKIKALGRPVPKVESVVQLDI